MKVFGYIRVSTNAQVDRDGLPRQLDTIRKYCRKNKFTLVKVFREEGISGTLKDRPQLNEMLFSLVQNGLGIEAIVIERLDRLGRDLMTQEFLIEQFKKSNVRLISVCEGADLESDEPTRKLIRQLLGAIAEFDKTLLVGRLQAARQRKILETGKCGGTDPYASTDQNEKNILRKMKYHKSKGRSYFQIAEILNRKGFKTRKGEFWQRTQISYLLKRNRRKDGRKGWVFDPDN